MIQFLRPLAAALLVLACALSSFANAGASQASGLRCKDCPFPMRIGDNQWLMPGNGVVVEIYEQRLPDSSYEMSVALLDSDTGEQLAAGTTKRAKNQRSVTITLIDKRGRRVDGEITWVNYSRGTIQAKFTCMTGTCSIDRKQR